MNHLIEVLHSVSNKLTNITQEFEVYQILNDGIKQILPESYFIITKLQPDDMNFRITHHFGFDNYFTTIMKMIDKDPFNMDFPFSDLSESKQEKFRTRKVFHFPGGIYEIANGRINKIICKSIEKILGISEVYAVSFCIGDKHFGGSTLFIPKINLEFGKLSDDLKLTIENLAAQASFAINRIRDFEALSVKENELEIANRKLEIENQQKTKYSYELKIAKEKTEESEKLLSIIARNYPNSFVSVINKDLTVGFTSGEEFYKQDLNPDDFVGLTLEQVFGENAEFVKKHYLKAFAGDKQSFELFINDQYQQYNAVPLYNDKNEICQILAVVENITSRKFAEQKIYESEQRLRTYINSTSDIVFTLDTEQRHTGVFGDWYKKAGMQESDFIGKTGEEIIGESSIIHEEANKKVLNGESLVYEWSTSVNGMAVYFQTALSPLKNKNKNNEIIGIIGIGRNITTQKKALIELKDSKEKIDSIFNNMPDVLWSLSYPDLKPILISKSAKDLYGYSSEQFINDSKLWLNATHPDDRYLSDKAYSDLEKTGKSNRECRIICPNGDIKYIQDRNWFVYENDKAVRIDGITKDITKQVNAEKSLKESEIKYRTLVDKVNDGFYIVDSNGVLTFANRALTQILGFKHHDEVIGKKFMDFLPKDKVDEIFNQYRLDLDSLKDPKASNVKIISNDGLNKFIEIKPQIILENGKPIGSRGVINDITDRKKFEAELLNAEKKYRIITQASLDIIFILDKKGRIIFSNDSMATILGYELDTVLGTSFTIYVPKREIPRYLKKLASVFINKEIRNFSTQVYHKDGRLFDVEINGKLIQHEGKLAAQGTIRDISERKKSEKALINSETKLKESNAAKDKFFSIIAHDLRSPFNAMLGFSNILITDFDKYDKKRQKKFIGIIDQGLNDTFKLLENLLYWSRAQKGSIEFKPEVLNLYLLYDEISKLLNQSANNKSIEIISQIPENINITADKEMLSTVIRNLVSNAIKFTHKSGKILISARMIDNNTAIEVSVKDNGVGISQEMQDNMFDIGVSTTSYGTENEKGTGLGLILCKEFIEKHNGKIWIDSEEGNGSTFYFTIPLT